MSTNRTPYERQTDRRRARAMEEIAGLRAALDTVERQLTAGVTIPDPHLTPRASKLDETLAALGALEELAEDLELIPSFQARARAAAQQREEARAEEFGWSHGKLTKEQLRYRIIVAGGATPEDSATRLELEQALKDAEEQGKS